jgi:hypothetical protein
MHTKFAHRVGRWSRAALALGLVAALPGCTEVQRQGESPAYLIITSLSGASGVKPTEFANVLASDVVTFVKKQVGQDEQFVPTIFADNGRVTFILGLKDPGAPGSTTSPTTTNFITVTRYRVTFIRSDGRNTPGVDVPYAFDGGMTLTVTDTTAVGNFNLVRIQAKQEAPLQALSGGGGANAISTIAEITFYGTDQAGRAVSVTGRIGVNFADWGDPS